MKPYQFLTTILLFLIITNLSAQVGIGTVSPNASAALEIKSTTRGFLPPRMTHAEKIQISVGLGTKGLMVYCTDCGDNGELQFYNGTSWVNMIAIPTGENGDLLTNDGTNWVAEKPSIQAHESQTINIRNPYLGIHYIIALQGIFPYRSSADPFLAEIIMFGGNFAPRGWAFCNGQLGAINGNEALFSLLGTIYGGDGRSTFGLPDLRGRTPVHPSTDPGLPQVQLGQTGGSESITIPKQTHVITYE